MNTTTAARATSYEVLDRFLASYWTARTRDNERVHPFPVVRLVP
jgi:hypothetical protein